jgi:hypothetical protein
MGERIAAVGDLWSEMGNHQRSVRDQLEHLRRK